MPEVRYHKRCPFTVSDTRRNWSYNFDLPTTIVERLSDAIVAPFPLHFGVIVENGIEFVKFEVATWIREPRHRDDVAVGCLNNTAFTKAFSSWIGWNECSALQIRCYAGNPRIPVMSTIDGPYRVFPTDVEN